MSAASRRRVLADQAKVNEEMGVIQSSGDFEYGAPLTVPNLGPPLPDYGMTPASCGACAASPPGSTFSTGEAAFCEVCGAVPAPESTIPAVPPAEAPQPSPADITRACIDAVVYLDECLWAHVDAARHVENAQLRWQAARSAKAAQMLADGTRLASIGGVTYEARKGRKGAAPTLVPVKVEE